MSTKSGHTASPARIVIGVTGHRRLDNEAHLAKEAAAVLEKIKKHFPPQIRHSVAFTVLSPLAEGADRLVARVVLESAGGQLDVVTPMEKEEYAAHFSGPGSRVEFERFFSKAKSCRRLPSFGSRTEAYARVGRYVVDHCDVLIAIWDGRAGEGEGGTADTVGYARTRRCPLFWIRADGRAKTTFEPGRGISVRADREKDTSHSVN